MAQQDSGINFSSYLPIIISTAVVMLTIVGGFWSLADPRAELKNIRDNYLSIREHEEFVRRFDRDVERLDHLQVQLHRDKLDTTTAENLHKSLDNEIVRLQQDSVSKAEFYTLVKERENQISRLQKELDNLQAQVDRRSK